MNPLASFLLFLTIWAISGFQEFGFPGGFFQYGDMNKDGKIDQADLGKNMNLAWLKEYYDLMNTAPEEIKRSGAIMEQQYLNLLKANDQGILLLLMLSRYFFSLHNYR